MEEPIGSLWIQQGKRGEYLSGVVNGTKVIIFRNTYKQEGSKQPDWKVYARKSLGEKNA